MPGEIKGLLDRRFRGAGNARPTCRLDPRHRPIVEARWIPAARRNACGIVKWTGEGQCSPSRQPPQLREAGEGSQGLDG
jgi:hypothetical protein